MANAINLNINIEIDVLTAGTIAEVINEVLEFLLFQRNQIPFVYKTFKYYVLKWEEDEQNNDSDDVPHNFNMERQRELAKETKKSISAMRELVNEVLRRNEIKTLRYLLGPTTLTPIESYTIHIPTSLISRKHSYENHRLPQTRLNQSLITLLTSEELYAIFSRNLSSTNVFLELEIIDDKLSSHTTKSNVFPKDLCALPSSCKDVHFHLMHSKPFVEEENNRLHCCKELQIFSALPNLSLTSSHPTYNINNNFSALESVWWEAETVIRGFKEKTTKGSNIWTNKC